MSSVLKSCTECGKGFRSSLGHPEVLTCGFDCAEERERRRSRLRTYGLTVAAYDQIWEEQRGRCAICGKAEERLGRRFSVDHNHACCPGPKSCGECVRGLLCGNCNVGLGNFGDNVHTLRKAIVYVERHKVERPVEEHVIEDDWGTAWVGENLSVGDR